MHDVNAVTLGFARVRVGLTAATTDWVVDTVEALWPRATDAELFVAAARIGREVTVLVVATEQSIRTAAGAFGALAILENPMAAALVVPYTLRIAVRMGAVGAHRRIAARWHHTTLVRRALLEQIIAGTVGDNVHARIVGPAQVRVGLTVATTDWVIHIVPAPRPRLTDAELSVETARIGREVAVLVIATGWTTRTTTGVVRALAILEDPMAPAFVTPNTLRIAVPTGAVGTYRRIAARRYQTTVLWLARRLLAVRVTGLASTFESTRTYTKDRPGDKSRPDRHPLPAIMSHC